MNLNELKKQAAEKAVTFVRSEMVVGLGTGSTAVHAVRAIGRLLQEGQLQNIIAIPTSEATAAEARRWHIPLTSLDEHPVVDLTIDGADEIDPTLNLIKGLGGALLREKIVAFSSRRLIIIADHTKAVSQLGTRAPVPVEVIPFARRPVTDYLSSLGTRVQLRMNPDGKTPFYTDEGNLILDCYFDNGIENPTRLARALRARPGVVEHGLFLNLAHMAILASPDGLDIRQR
ncbi:MAG: ribose-5-phosphate isomerase RpiA [Chloroflexi bacterium]|nr:MAG: ribose-5-phosphate isomerase RpiA [Chloroflexota bacterium]